MYHYVSSNISTRIHSYGLVYNLSFWNTEDSGGHLEYHKYHLQSHHKLEQKHKTLPNPELYCKVTYR